MYTVIEAQLTLWQWQCLRNDVVIMHWQEQREKRKTHEDLANPLPFPRIFGKHLRSVHRRHDINGQPVGPTPGEPHGQRNRTHGLSSPGRLAGNGQEQA